MELRIYLCIHRISITEMAKRLNITRTHLGNVMHHRPRYRCSWRLAQQIEKQTNGEVTAAEAMGKKPLPMFDL